MVFSPIHPDIFATAAHDKTVKFWDKRVKDCVTEEGDGGADVSVRMDEREKSNPPKRSRGEERGDKDRKRDKEETGECLLGLF